MTATESVRIHALIPAAGLSVRFGGTTLKQYAHLLGKPVIAHSIEALSRHPAVAAVTVALAEDDGIFDALLGEQYPLVNTVTGGPSRAHTVLNGLRAIRAADPACEWVLVHDAARPCLPFDALDRLLQQGLQSDHGGLLAIPVSDTLKLATEDQHIQTTVDRSGLWAAQTPQLFRLDELLQAQTAALQFGLPPTDEAQALERAGGQPLLVTGSPLNIKITGPEDLALAEVILRHQAERPGA